MIDPVLASDKLSYERHAIERCLRSSSRSPNTNCSLQHLRANEALRANIAAWTELRLCFISPREPTPLLAAATEPGGAEVAPAASA